MSYAEPLAFSTLHQSPGSVPLASLRRQLVADLCQISTLHTLSGAAEAGRILSMYRLEAARREGKPKPGVVSADSFRQLARLEGMRLSASSLCRAVAIHQLAQRAPALLTYRHVGVGHVSAVLTLDFQSQAALLSLAERYTWSRGQLQSEVDARRVPRPFMENPHAPVARSAADAPKTQTEAQFSVPRLTH